jgi:hypothetical protein
MMDPRVLAANVTVAVEALERMIGLEDSDPDRIRYELAHDTLKAWLAGRCPTHGPHPHEDHGGRCLDCPQCVS